VVGTVCLGRRDSHADQGAVATQFSNSTGTGTSPPEVSTVILGTKSVAHADSNFGQVPGGRLSRATLEHFSRVQDKLGLWGRRERAKRLWRGLMGRG
jgi:hypothetical protein